MALAAGALLMTTANAQDSAEPAASDASGTKPPMDELASLKQNPVSGLRRVSFDAVVAHDAPTSGQTEGVYSLQVVWPFALPTPVYKLLTYSMLPVLRLPESSSGDTTVGLGNILLNVFVGPTKSDRFLVYAGGGLNSLGGIAIDGEGNLWADDNFPANDPGNAEPFKVGIAPRAVAIDSHGNAWVANTVGHPDTAEKLA